MSHAAAKLLRDPTLDKFTAPRVGRVLPEFAPPVREPKIRLEFGVREHMPRRPAGVAEICSLQFLVCHRGDGGPPSSPPGTLFPDRVDLHYHGRGGGDRAAASTCVRVEALAGILAAGRVNGVATLRADP